MDDSQTPATSTGSPVILDEDDWERILMALAIFDHDEGMRATYQRVLSLASADTRVGMGQPRMGSRAMRPREEEK